MSATAFAERTIAAPPSAVFEWLANSHNYKAVPFVLAERLAKPGEDGAYGLGAVREVTCWGAWFREEITAYDAPQQFQYLVIKSFPPVDHHGGTVTVKAVAGGSHVTWSSPFTLSRLLGGKIAEKLSKRIMQANFRQTLKAADQALAGNRPRRG